MMKIDKHFILKFVCCLVLISIAACKNNPIENLTADDEMSQDDYTDADIIETPQEDPAQEENQILENDSDTADDGCAVTYSDDDIIGLVELSANVQVLFPGESVGVAWNSAVDNASVILKKNDIIFSDASHGQYDFIPTENTHITMTVEYCGTSITRALSITVRSWELQLEDVGILYKNPNGRMYAGTQDGSLYRKYFNQGNSEFEQVSDSRNSYYDAAGIIYNDRTPLDAILQGSSACEGMLFLGSSGGFVYRSEDNGVTSMDNIGQDYAFHFFYTSNTDPFANPSSVIQILESESNPGELYILHASGVARMSDCLSNDPLTQMVSINISSSNVDFEWTHPVAGVNFQGRIYIANDDGLYSSSDGITWHLEDDIDNDVQWMRVRGDRLYIGTISALHDYDGVSWNYVEAILPQDVIFTDSIALKAASKKLYLSRDMGESWTEINGFPSPIKQIEYSKLGQDYWVLTHGGSLYKLTLSPNLKFSHSSKVKIN